MRCTGCGWENPDTNTNCEKCGASLQSENRNYANAPAAGSPFNKTRIEAEVFPDLAAPQPVTPTCREEEPAAPAAHTPTPHAVHQAAPAGGYQGTVNPWIQVAPKSQCTLTPIQQDTDETAPKAISFKGEQHILNRANLDEENYTITSKVQAELTCEDGVWYIQDGSQQQTTFVHAGNKTPLRDGDVVLMGNRQFVFHTDK